MVVGFALLAAACSGGSAPQEHLLSGAYAVHGDYAGAIGTTPAPGGPCRAADVGYRDAAPGRRSSSEATALGCSLARFWDRAAIR